MDWSWRDSPALLPPCALQGLAESLDLSLGGLLEGMALHALENRPPFSAATLKKIADLKRVYGLDPAAGDSHRLREKS